MNCDLQKKPAGDEGLTGKGQLTQPRSQGLSSLPPLSLQQQRRQRRETLGTRLCPYCGLAINFTFMGIIDTSIIYATDLEGSLVLFIEPN